MKNNAVRISRKVEALVWGKVSIKLFLAIALMLSVVVVTQAQEQKAIKLNSPNKDTGFSIMKSLSLRQTTRDIGKWSDKDLSQQDLSNLMWAGAGVNREDGKRTAASAMNAQDVTIYAIMKDGAYAYDSASHILNLVASGDHRSEIGVGRGGAAPAGGGAAGQPFSYPLKVILVSDLGKFRAGTAELKSDWGAFDAGLVAQNMMLYCSGMGLLSHPKAAVDGDGKIKNLLKLTDSQHSVIELDIGYPKQ
jgi:nitroreductase